MVTTSSSTVMVAPGLGRGPSSQAPVPWPLASLRTIRASSWRPARAAAWATPLTRGSAPRVSPATATAWGSTRSSIRAASRASPSPLRLTGLQFT